MSKKKIYLSSFIAVATLCCSSWTVMADQMSRFEEATEDARAYEAGNKQLPTLSMVVDDGTDSSQKAGYSEQTTELFNDATSNESLESIDYFDSEPILEQEEHSLSSEELPDVNENQDQAIPEESPDFEPRQWRMAKIAPDEDSLSAHFIKTWEALGSVTNTLLDLTAQKSELPLQMHAIGKLLAEPSLDSGEKKLEKPKEKVADKPVAILDELGRIISYINGQGAEDSIPLNRKISIVKNQLPKTGERSSVLPQLIGSLMMMSAVLMATKKLRKN